MFVCECANCAQRFELVRREQAEPQGEEATLFVGDDGDVLIVCPTCGSQEEVC
jgi:hypothetical protein